MAICRSCKYFKNVNGMRGYCQYNPPTGDTFPEARSSDVCRKHERKRLHAADLTNNDFKHFSKIVKKMDSKFLFMILLQVAGQVDGVKNTGQACNVIGEAVDSANNIVNFVQEAEYKYGKKYSKRLLQAFFNGWA